MTISPDGGWFTAILLIGLLVVGIMAYRKRWPTSPKPALIVVGEPRPTPAPAKEPAKSATKHDNLTAIGGKLLIGLIIVAVLAYIFVHWSDLTATRTKTTATVVTHESSHVVQRASANAASGGSDGLADQLRIEAETYTIELTDGAMPGWINGHKGYKAYYEVTSDGNPVSTIGRQCSSALEKPAQDAGGEEYWCDSDHPSATWFRFYIYDHEVPKATVKVYFRRK